MRIAHLYDMVKDGGMDRQCLLIFNSVASYIDEGLDTKTL